MICVNIRWWDFFEYIWECNDMTYERRTVLAACECGFESCDQNHDFIYVGY